MTQIIKIIILFTFFSNFLYSEDKSSLFFINNSDPLMLKIKNFINQNSDDYPEDQIFKISDNINFEENGFSDDLQIYFFKIDKEFIIPFITTNFNKFVHKDLMVKINELIYDHLFYNFEFFPLNVSNEENMALMSYPNENEVIIILPIFKANLRFR